MAPKFSGEGRAHAKLRFYCFSSIILLFEWGESRASIGFLVHRRNKATHLVFSNETTILTHEEGGVCNEDI